MRFRPARRTTEFATLQVVPDDPYGAPVAVDEQTASRVPAQCFDAQAPAAGTQVHHRTPDDPGRQDIEQRSAHAAAGGTHGTGYGLQSPTLGGTCTDSQHDPPLSARTVSDHSENRIAGGGCQQKSPVRTPARGLFTGCSQVVREVKRSGVP